MKALFTNIQARGRATNVIATRRRNVDDSAIKNAELVTACNAKHATNEDAVKFEIDEMTIDQIVEANQDRNNLIINAQHYDPITGEGSCGPRVKRSVDIDDSLNGDYWIPEPMAAELDAAPCTTRTQWELLRIRHDFEFWCAAFIMILDKVSGRLVNLVLRSATASAACARGATTRWQATATHHAQGAPVGRQHTGAALHGMDSTRAQV